MTETEQDKDFEDLLTYLQEPDQYIGPDEILGILTNPPDLKVISRHFDEKTLVFFKAIVKAFKQDAEFHRDEDEEAHEKHILRKIRRLEGRLNNHRHQHEGSFTHKPEY